MLLIYWIILCQPFQVEKWTPNINSKWGDEEVLKMKDEHNIAIPNGAMWWWWWGGCENERLT